MRKSSKGSHEKAHKARFRRRGRPSRVASVAAVPSGKTSSVRGWRSRGLPHLAARSRETHSTRVRSQVTPDEPCSSRRATAARDNGVDAPTASTPSGRHPQASWIDGVGSAMEFQTVSTPSGRTTKGWIDGVDSPRASTPHRPDTQQPRPGSTGGSPCGIRHDRPFDHGLGKRGGLPSGIHPHQPEPDGPARRGGLPIDVHPASRPLGKQFDQGLKRRGGRPLGVHPFRPAR